MSVKRSALVGQWYELDRNGKFKCTLCGGKSMKSFADHEKLSRHKTEVARKMGDRPQVSPTGPMNPVWTVDDLESDHLRSRSEAGDSDHEAPGLLIPQTLTEIESAGEHNSATTSEAFGSFFDVNCLEAESKLAPLDEDLDQLLGRVFKDYEVNDISNIEDVDDSKAPDLDLVEETGQDHLTRSNGVYPFKKVEHLAGFLLAGCTRTLMSRSQYERVRSVIKLCSVELPEWGSLRKLRDRLKSRLGVNLAESHSPLGNPCYNLKVKEVLQQEMANPFVVENLVCVPETDEGVAVDRFSQCRKWRELLPRDLRVQMVELGAEHYYIYEPVQLESGDVVVPIFFYQHKSVLMAKCLPLRMVQIVEGYRMELAEEGDFDSNQYKDVEVSCFSRTFPNIKLGSGIWNGQYLAEVAGYELWQPDKNRLVPLPLPNPWRKKADGMVIKHVPINLYSDDTSGNVSKKFNKHMSFMSTLAGLPPDLTNQEYHMHFLATSNRASALELAGALVDELNDISTNGLVAYHAGLRKKVLVMTCVLAHMGDSPMHAEITNTTNPSSSLNPCRVCSLNVDKKVEKQTTNYISSFVGVNPLGQKIKLHKRSWTDTKSRTKELWNLAKLPGNINRFKERSTYYGVRDTLNLELVKIVQDWHRAKVPPDEVLKRCKDLENKYGEDLFNPLLRLKGFDGHRDTPVEALHVILLGVVKYLYRDSINSLSAKVQAEVVGRWAAFNIGGLKTGPIQPTVMVQFANSLVGKEFRLALQACAFVLFPYLTKEKRELWSLLGHLGSYAFQTKINNKADFLAELQIIVDRTMHKLVAISGQWTNKPKFHHLTHLPESIDLFGPAPLFATERFESYNGILRAASIHSNRQSPGRDIANTFNNYRLMRLLLSGAFFWDSTIGRPSQAGPRIREFFGSSLSLQQALGYHHQIGHGPDYPTWIVGSHDCPAEIKNPPSDLLNFAGPGEWKQASKLLLPNGQQFGVGAFICVHNPNNSGSLAVGFVEDLWHKQTCNGPTGFVELTYCKPQPDLHEFYLMRPIEKTTIKRWFSPEEIEAVVNVQHDCFKSTCPITKTRHCRIERQLTNICQPEVTHLDSKSYIINAASLYSAEIHRDLSNRKLLHVTQNEWVAAIQAGLETWKSKGMASVTADPVTQAQPQDTAQGSIVGLAASIITD